MTEQSTAAEYVTEPLGPRFAIRTFYLFAALAALSMVISIAGKWIGGTIASVGHTDDTRSYEIVIGNNVLAVPGNHIRFASQRADGEAHRLDLYVRWPDLAGYSDDVRDDFNRRDGVRRIIFLSLEPRLMSRDMSGRFDPLYRRLIELPGESGPNGLSVYRFSAASGYMNELLLVGDLAGKVPFVARCLTGAPAEDTLAGCERDVHVGDELSLSYRFPEELLGEWRILDAAIVGKAREMLRTAQ